MKTTTVLNLFGGPATGKSTLAAELYAKLKTKGISCELVREYLKIWAWEGKEIRPVDQIYLLGQQAQAEAVLYGKVDYIITDSPVLLPAVYQKLFHEGTYIGDAAKGIMTDARKHHNVKYENYVLIRQEGPYESEGRYQDLETAKQIDEAIINYLYDNTGEGITLLYCPINDRVNDILTNLGV